MRSWPDTGALPIPPSRPRLLAVVDLPSSTLFWLAVAAGLVFVEVLITALLLRLCSKAP
jgi:hypothetical protein